MKHSDVFAELEKGQRMDPPPMARTEAKTGISLPWVDLGESPGVASLRSGDSTADST